MISGTVITKVLERKSSDLQKIFENKIADLLGDIRGDYRIEIGRQFDAQGIPRWEKLSVKYAEKKRRIVGEKPILQFTERMVLGYITGGKISGNTLTFEYPTKYARRHQKGLNMPKRAINLNFVERIGVKRMSAFATESVKKVGFETN